MSNARHILIKEIDVDDPEEFTYRVECQISGGCGGWLECDEPHEVAGQNAKVGPDDCDPAAPWWGSEEFEFHGVVHTWRYSGHGWTVPYSGCIVAAVDWVPPEEVEDDLPPGRYEVDDEWDDTELTLVYRGPEATP